jgi:hypothetical protein
MGPGMDYGHEDGKEICTEIREYFGCKQAARSDFAIFRPKTGDNVTACFSDILKTVHSGVFLNMSLHFQDQNAPFFSKRNIAGFESNLFN